MNKTSMLLEAEEKCWYIEIMYRENNRKGTGA